MGRNVKLAAGIAVAKKVAIIRRGVMVLRVFLWWRFCLFWMICSVFLAVYSIVRSARVKRSGNSGNAYLCCIHGML